MAYRSSGHSNETLVENLSKNGLVRSPRVREAMLKVDRGHYAPRAPYQDSPQPLGHGATISAPHMHAAACESLLPHLGPGARVLDVGSGSGYLTLVLAELVRPGGRVVGVEHVAALAASAEVNARRSVEGSALLDARAVSFVCADGRRGWAEEAPFDAIHVGAAAAAWHQELLDQLKAPGRLFIPVEEDFVQHIYVVDKDKDGKITRKKEFGVQYVPLTDAPRE